MTTAGQNQSAGTAPSEIGTVLAQRYEVVRELGRGGMGVVYLCQDIVTGDRVALKRLRSPEKGETPRRGELVVSPGGARRRAARPPGHRARARLRPAGRRQPVLRDGRASRAQRPRVDAHDAPAVERHLGDGRSGARGARARPRARRHPRRPEAVEHHARPGVARRSARARSCSTSGSRGCASTATTRGSTASRAPEVAVHSGAGTVGWVAPEQIRRQARSWARRPISTRSAASCTASSAGARSSRATRRTCCAPTSERRSRRRRCATTCPRRRASSCCACWRRSRGIATSSRPTRGARGSGSGRRRRRRSRRSSRARRARARRRLGLRTLAGAGHPQPARARCSSPARRSAASSGAPVEARRRAARTRQELIALIGEAGVGKSRVAEWLCAEAHERGVMVPLRARYGRTPSPLDGITGAINAHFGLTGADRATVEQTLMMRWEVAQGRRRGAHLGGGDRRVAAADAARTSWRRIGSHGQALRARPPRASLQRHQAGARADRAATGPILMWLDDLHFASPEHVRDALAPSPRRARPAAAHRRDGAQRDARDRPRRRAPHGGAARRVGRARSSSSSRSRPTTPRRSCAPRCRSTTPRCCAPSSRAAATRSSRCSSSTRGRAAGT